jgi:hypothetical protein
MRNLRRGKKQSFEEKDGKESSWPWRGRRRVESGD